MAHERHYDKPATTNEEKTKRLKRGFPLGPGSQRVTKKPPKTSRGKNRASTPVGVSKEMGQYNADVIQERLAVEKELGLR